MRSCFFGLVCVFAMCGHAWAASLQVPAKYAGIAAAYNAAREGDEIVISPGTYIFSAPIKVAKNNITFRSTFDGNDWTAIRKTIIKGFPGDINNLFEIATKVSGTKFRGLTLTHERLTSHPSKLISRRGIIGEPTSSNTTIEFCIIENCSFYGTQLTGPGEGAALAYIAGIVQNCIIRNNNADAASDMYMCRGIVRNCLFYNDARESCSVSLLSGEFSNNTVYYAWNGACALGFCKVVNSIFWSGTPSFGYDFRPKLMPRNCVIKGYNGAGMQIIKTDPKFIDLANGDFRLASDSPCIDAGITTATTVKADIFGVQRGIKGVSEYRGDYSRIDIGAHEFKPTPLAVWLPGGGPDQIRAGDALKVAWEMVNPPAGTAITLELYRDGHPVSSLGSFWNPRGAGESVVSLPKTIVTPASYTIRGFSNSNRALFSETPRTRILAGKNAATNWVWYR